MQRYPADPARGALLVLAHGAGAGQRHPFMVRVARGLAARGIDVATFDFPYMRQKRRAPDRAPVLERAFADAITEARAAVAADRQLFIGGKSMGGRIATHLAAQGVDDLRGVVALGYPLHPPGRPEQLRVEHLPAIGVAVLIVQGERDAFGTPGELRRAIAQMTAPVTLHVVAQGDHSLAVPASAPEAQSVVNERILDAIAGWIISHSGGAAAPARSSPAREG